MLFSRGCENGDVDTINRGLVAGMLRAAVKGHASGVACLLLNGVDVNGADVC